jgi:tetratricopeptide (TPR) repeat protein
MKTKNAMTRSLAYVLAALMVTASPSVATAQQQEQSTAKPTDEQLELNAEAVGAITEGEHAKAVELLERANQLGQFNVTWLNLGRAYQKMGECDKARQAYLNVISAPAVKDPSPRLINAKADQYLGELDEECTTVDDARQKMAAGEEAHVETKGDEGQQVKEPTDLPAESSQAESSQAESSNAVGWTLTATGLVVAGAGIGAHFWAESIRDDVTGSVEAADGGVVEGMSRQEALSKESRANTLDTVGVSAIAVGAVVTGTGVFLLLSSDDLEAAPTASVTAGGDVSLGVTGRF